MNYFLRVVFEPILGPLGWRGFHASRHAFATDLAASNIPRATLQELMEHRPGSNVTDAFYVHGTAENRMTALALLSNESQSWSSESRIEQIVGRWSESDLCKLLKRW